MPRTTWPDGSLRPTRVERLADGSQRILEYVGNDRQLKDSGDAALWRPFMEIGVDEVLGEWVKCSAEVKIARLYATKGDVSTPVIGVLLDFGTTRVAAPIEEWRAALPKISEIVG